MSKYSGLVHRKRLHTGNDSDKCSKYHAMHAELADLVCVRTHSSLVNHFKMNHSMSRFTLTDFIAKPVQR